MESFTQAQWPQWTYAGMDPFPNYNQVPAYPTYLADSIEAAYQSHQQHLVHHHQMSRTTESKPRLSKEEVEILEAEFQKNHKPNSSTKKALAESMRVDNARINNWFQNRRAREKKENNIRAYEARQKLEKQKAGADTNGGSDDERQRDLVASTAPFPLAQKSTRSATFSSDASPDSPLSDSDALACQESEYDDAPSPQASAHSSQHFPSIEESDCESDTKVKEEADQLPSYISMPDSIPHMPTAELGLQSFGSFVPLDTKTPTFLMDSYQNLMGSDENGDLSPPFSAHTFTSGPSFLDGQSVPDQTDFQESSDESANFSTTNAFNTSLSPEMNLKAPRAIDIAARRNRRPPPLSINGGRNFSAGPKTAVDMSKRGQFGNPMRRVASVNGSVRIAKTAGLPPRSPFGDRKAEGLLQLNRSPNMNGPGRTIAPPTPNTPIVTSQQSLDDVITTTFSLIGDKTSQDPTMRTPPTTPGIMDQLFNLNAAYDMSLGDEPLATPGLGRFPGEFEIPSMSTSVPGYLAQDCGSQPETPLYPHHVGPAYFGYTGGNPEYNWSEVSSSAKSSPGQSAHVQFMNMTASNFS